MVLDVSKHLFDYFIILSTKFPVWRVRKFPSTAANLSEDAANMPASAALVAKTAIAVDLKSGLLSSRACALSHASVEP